MKCDHCGFSQKELTRLISNLDAGLRQAVMTLQEDAKPSPLRRDALAQAAVEEQSIDE